MLTLGFLTGLLLTAFVLVCALLLLVILIQKPRGGGLSGAFGGGAGSAQAAFGAKTGDVLTWVTVVLFASFLLLAIFLTWNMSAEHNGGDAVIADPMRTSSTPIPTEPTTPAPTQPSETGGGAADGEAGN